SAGSSPAMIRRIVLLPDPDGPSSATSCPDGTSNDTPSTAWNEPNRFERLRTTIATSHPQGSSYGWPTAEQQWPRAEDQWPMAEGQARRGTWKIGPWPSAPG